MPQQVENLYKAVIKRVSQLDPFQAKKLSTPTPVSGSNLESDANLYLMALTAYLKTQNLELEDAVKAYVSLCSEIRQETLVFAREQSYSRENQEIVNKELYSNPQKMLNCLLGLGLSQFLWPNHYSLYSFYLKFLKEGETQFQSCLEIGPGHGAYLAASIKCLPKANHYAYDLSPTSVEFCKGLLHQSSNSRETKLEWLSSAFGQSSFFGKFDLITIGEVIEHLDDPIHFLGKTKSLLSPSGKIFLTTCANCPARDHVYLFRSAKEIQLLLQECGFGIEQELILEVNPTSNVSTLSSLNYGAVLKPKPVAAIV